MEADSRLVRALQKLSHAGVQDSDSDDERLRKATLTLVVLIIVPLASLWTISYALMGLSSAAVIPLLYQILSLTSLILFTRNKHFNLFCFTQLSLILLLPVLMHVRLGGFSASSAVVLWAFVAPLGALLCKGTRYAIPWFAAFVIGVGSAALIDASLTVDGAAISLPIRILFFFLNLCGVSFTAFLLLQYFVRGRDRARNELDAKHEELQREQERSEQLLLNILPPAIAERLKDGETLIADRVQDATVLFADIVGFTALTRRNSPEQLIAMLNELFSAFDRLAVEYGLEKIKTIGDSYMLVGGLSDEPTDHVAAVSEISLAMQKAMQSLAYRLDQPLSLRVGIDCGPVVAGVIGQQKFSYDIWGDTVNTASRMASHGTPGSVQVTGKVVERLHDRFLFQSRGSIEIKGKGMMHVYLLRGRIATAGLEQSAGVAPS